MPRKIKDYDNEALPSYDYWEDEYPSYTWQLSLNWSNQNGRKNHIADLPDVRV